jgi:thioredoxin-related protein
MFALIIFIGCKGNSSSSDKFKVDPEPIIQDALKNKKFLILVFESADCRYCEKLNIEVLSQPDFKEKQIKNRVNIAIINAYGNRLITDPETKQKMEESALAVANRVSGFPTIVVYDPEKDFKVIFFQPGYIPKNDFMDFLDYLGSKCYQKVKYQKFIENGKSC